MRIVFDPGWLLVLLSGVASVCFLIRLRLDAKRAEAAREQRMTTRKKRVNAPKGPVVAGRQAQQEERRLKAV